MLYSITVSVLNREREMKRHIYLILILSMLLALFCSCASKEDEMKIGYEQISQEEAKVMMKADDGHIIVDVRRQDEYDAGHILGAICIPNESINDEMPEELPDLDQVILVYCRTGRRSKEAAGKLAGIGYTNIYEFGGILDWTGEVVK